MKILDLYSGDGGAAMGLHQAFPDAEITGIDIKRRPRYPFKFKQADALSEPLDGYDFIWASPPCQAFTRLRWMPDAKEHQNLIPQTRARLVEAGIPYVIENVEDAPLGESGFLIVLCGTMFGLQTPDGRAELRRHRLFETSFSIPLRPRCQHGASHTPVDSTGRRRAITVTGSTPQTNTIHNRVRETFSVEDARAAMGIDWMTMAGLSQAIPPAYSRFIGEQFKAAQVSGPGS